jgi:phosphoribosylanthranilate isomerase
MSVRIKFCGFTRAEDAAKAAALGVDAIGVVHVPGSKRHVPLVEMPAIRGAVPAHIDLVALFVNPDADTVHKVITALQPSLLQFHGDEPDAFCAGFGLPFIKAMAMGGDAGDIGQRQHDYPNARALVLDGHAPGALGGQGERFAWSNLPALDKPIYLAGGLDAGNVAEAIAIVQPAAVDVSSGIESTPGAKDLKKMQDFIRAARALG